MYTKEDLRRASRAIAVMAEREGVTEEHIRAEIDEAIQVSHKSLDPRVKAQWADIEFVGSEPSVEEFVTWLAEKVNTRLNRLE